MQFLATLNMAGALTMLAGPVAGRSLDRVRDHLRLLPRHFVAPPERSPALSRAAAMGITEAQRTLDGRADAALIDLYGELHRLAREAAADFDRQRFSITTYLLALVVRKVRDGLDGRAAIHTVLP